MIACFIELWMPVLWMYLLIGLSDNLLCNSLDWFARYIRYIFLSTKSVSTSVFQCRDCDQPLVNNPTNTGNALAKYSLGITTVRLYTRSEYGLRLPTYVCLSKMVGNLYKMTIATKLFCETFYLWTSVITTCYTFHTVYDVISETETGIHRRRRTWWPLSTWIFLCNINV